MKTFTCTLFTLIILMGLSHPTEAQCPPANPGHHRVQKGETLYKISRKYGVSVDQLSVWNGISKTDILKICQELAIVQPSAATTPTSVPPRPSSPALANMEKQGGTSHKIQQGETIAGIAQIYGYTEEHFRRFNGLSPTEPAWPGLVLNTSDCNCPAPGSNNATSEVGESQVSIGGNENDGGIYERETFPTWKEALEAEGATVDPNRMKAPFLEDPFYEEFNIAPAKQPSPSSYNQTQGRLRVERTGSGDWSSTGSFKNREKEAHEKSSLSPKVRRSIKSYDAPKKTYIPAEELLIKKEKRENRFIHPNPEKQDKPSSGLRITAIEDAARFMKPEEIEMINEINFVRSNPSGYVKYVEAYKAEVAAGRAFGSVATCDELIAELRRTPPLSILQPTTCIYNAAKNHGEDQFPTGTTDHIGSDGSYPSDRVRRECAYMEAGGENLVAGPTNIRNLVIMLLVDDGIPSRGHRRTLLDKSWRYVACYNIGPLGRYSSSWVQNFGK